MKTSHYITSVWSTFPSKFAYSVVHHQSSPILQLAQPQKAALIQLHRNTLKYLYLHQTLYFSISAQNHVIRLNWHKSLCMNLGDLYSSRFSLLSQTNTLNISSNNTDNSFDCRLNGLRTISIGIVFDNTKIFICVVQFYWCRQDLKIFLPNPYMRYLSIFAHMITWLHSIFYRCVCVCERECVCAALTQ